MIVMNILKHAAMGKSEWNTIQKSKYEQYIHKPYQMHRLYCNTGFHDIKTESNDSEKLSQCQMFYTSL